MRIVCLLFGLALILTFKSLGQSTPQRIGFDPKYAFKDLTMDTWTNKSGLVSNNVISIYQANNDYLWVTSYNGLQRFDGNKFEIYDQTNISELASNTFYECTQDKKGVLWFGTGASGIIGYDGKDFFKLDLPDTIPSSIVSIFSDSQGRLWIGTKNNGLYVKNNNGVLNKQLEIPNLTIHNISEDLHGNIWVATDNKGAFRINTTETKQFTTLDGLQGNLISTVYQKNDTTYIGTLNGLNIIIGDKVDKIEAFDKEIINDIVVDDYGVLWVGTERGIAKYSSHPQSYEVFSETDGLPSKRVVDLSFDNEGSLWVCTYEGGLVRFKAGIINNLTIKDGLTTNQVHIINRKDDLYYIGTQDGMINIFDGENIQYLELSEEFRKDVIRDIHFEEDTIWVANYKGLAKISNGNQQYINESNGLPNNNLRTIFKDSNDQIWLGSRTGGLIRFNENGQHKVYDKDSGLLTNYILSIAEDKQGNILIGTNAGGLSVLSPDGTLNNYSIQEDDSGSLIFGILTDDQDFVWLSTNLGLYRFFNNKIEKVQLHPSLKMEKFFDVVNDKTGNFWLSSAIGVIRITEGELYNYFEGNQNYVAYDFFGEDDGMESQECTGATKSYFDEETGKIWIPTFEGVAIIDPSQKVINQKIPNVYITQVQVDNSSIFPIQDGVKIKPGTFRYLFDITSLSFLAPSKVQFMYKLEGIDEQWNGPTKKRRIEYTNLPYGDYTLLVKGSNNDDIWNETGAKLSFTVMPFYFETLWFRIGLLAFFIALAWGLYTWRVYDIKKTNKVLRKMNTELDHFVYSASHDLRGPLTSTMGIVNLALDEKDPGQRDQYFGLIKQCTDKMNHFINELINYSKNKNDKIEYREFELKVVIDSIWEGLKERVTPRGISLEYDFSMDGKILGDETRLKVILRNLIHNAVVFSDTNKPTPIVKVMLRQNNRNIELSVIDNGQGIPKNVIDRVFDMFFRANDHSIGSGLGLYVVKETTQKLNATIEVKSEEGKGSSFKIILPTGA
ncbi:Two component regulator propeller [Reichenbachiella faecimaris]|uniref:histidine kinase n=1 Tax=Reichenbachiella faecimaris TaxID=692418 RepID=A0A1W2G7C6_REIFA|nr:sensor histidine kinase [Reichenbachiella faecimaris]SMD32404.1 Two component regulator propeller [Reichenbachiella faecimaris]